MINKHVDQVRFTETSRGRLPPAARGLPLLGSIPFILKSPLDFLMNARAELGDIYTLNLGLTKMVMLNHPRHIQHILYDHSHNYTKNGAIW